MGRVQRTYAINPDAGFIGDLAEPNSPHRIEVGELYLASGTLRPGAMLTYDSTNNGWTVTQSVANALGFLTYRADRVQSAESILQFSNGDEIEIATMGVYWALSGAAMNYGALLTYTSSSRDWDPVTADPPTTVAAIPRLPMTCAQRGGVSGAAEIFKLAVGMGRVR